MSGTLAKTERRRTLRTALALCVVLSCADGRAGGQTLVQSPNVSGWAVSVNSHGSIDLSGPFFQSVGTNGRACASCHQPSAAWSVTPADLQARFECTAGGDPIFRTNDGSNSPLADVSTVDSRRIAYGMLLSRAVLRVGLGVPDNAEFELVAVDDPYGFASAAELSLFRRPLPATNLRFETVVMWDGRETSTQRTSPDCYYGTLTCFSDLAAELRRQADGATLGHAAATHLPRPSVRDGVVDFERELLTAQAYDNEAGDLDADGARGGLLALAKQAFYFGINDTDRGDYRTSRPFDNRAFTLYDAWALVAESAAANAVRAAAQRAVYRGQEIFNQRELRMVLVKGLNDDLNRPVVVGTCTTCHNTPNVGTHSVPAYFDIGISDGSKRTTDLPLYTLRNKLTQTRVETTDPGRAMITGRWRDVGRFKPPSLRALAARPPYFHNGSAADLMAVVEFYNERFGMDLTDGEKTDLASFLGTL